MRNFALTYPQLMNQAIQSGLVENDLVRLRSAHEIAERLVDGLYRAEGVPFLCHLVRTASIAIAERQPLDVVLASLLHAAYILSYFDGSRRRRPRRSDRAFLRDRLGPQVEELISDYGRLPWHRAAIRQHLEQIPQATPETRQLLIMRLVNELEDHLDLAMAYTPATRGSARFASYGHMCVELAQALGRDRLAAELAEVFEQCAATKIPGQVVRNNCQGYEMVSRLWQANLRELCTARCMRWLRSARRRFRQRQIGSSA